MNEWALVVDSSCGETKETVESLGGYFVPYKIFYDGKEFDDGVNIKTKDILERSEKGILGKTSVPSIETIKELYREGLEKNKKLIVVSLSEKISGINNAFRLASLEEEFKDRVHVIKSKFFTPWISHIIHEFSSKEARSASFDKVKKWLEEINEQLIGVLTLKDTSFLGASGRISSSQARLGKLAGIKPGMVWEDGEVDKGNSIKARSYKKAIIKAGENILRFMTDNNIELNDEYYIGHAWNQSDETRESTKEYLKEVFGNITIYDQPQTKLEGVVLVHVGSDITGVGLFRRFVA